MATINSDIIKVWSEDHSPLRQRHPIDLRKLDPPNSPRIIIYSIHRKYVVDR